MAINTLFTVLVQVIGPLSCGFGVSAAVCLCYDVSQVIGGLYSVVSGVSRFERCAVDTVGGSVGGASPGVVRDYVGV